MKKLEFCTYSWRRCRKS